MQSISLKKNNNNNGAAMMPHGSGMAAVFCACSIKLNIHCLKKLELGLQENE
jgi:hypothetical protein